MQDTLIKKQDIISLNYYWKILKELYIRDAPYQMSSNTKMVYYIIQFLYEDKEEFLGMGDTERSF